MTKILIPRLFIARYVKRRTMSRIGKKAAKNHLKKFQCIRIKLGSSCSQTSVDQENIC